jgi:hypothetical protein
LVSKKVNHFTKTRDAIVYELQQTSGISLLGTAKTVLEGFQMVGWKINKLI